MIKEIAYPDSLDGYESLGLDEDYARHQLEQHSGYVRISTGVGVTGDMCLAAFADQPASTPGRYGSLS